MDTPENELDELISNVGFHRNKAKYVRPMLAKWCFLTATSPQCSLALYLASGRFIKRTSEILREEYDDDIPPDYEGLLKLPGVGPKMAHLTMQCAWHKYVPLIQFLQGRLSLFAVTFATTAMSRCGTQDGGYWC